MGKLFAPKLFFINSCCFLAAGLPFYCPAAKICEKYPKNTRKTLRISQSIGALILEGQSPGKTVRALGIKYSRRSANRLAFDQSQPLSTFLFAFSFYQQSLRCSGILV